MQFKKIITSLLIMTLLITGQSLAVLAGNTQVVSLGADLSAEQKEAILKEFGVSENEVNIIEVSIQDVQKYLKGASKSQIGTKAISSAYVKLLPEGEGLFVDTHNVTAVSKEMYANAMVTAGVKDAEVKVAAPFKVTGTTALTGIMMAFEEATGKKLDDAAKETANEELELTQNIGDEIGKEKATELIQKVKREILKQKIETPEDMRQVIINIANELNIKLTDEQVDQILKLMEKISKLDLNVDTIVKQLDKISKNLEIVKNTLKENKGLFQRIIDAILGWLRNIFA
ncbi:MAG: DUF1002 domain-containing protein [Zhaonellaceae bacterium]|jgi:uncharacterized protein YpuA (DUF1002 family)|nr:DUF1002 domain-containing protein [Clostridia bacterium]